MNPIEYLESLGFRITSDPDEYYEQYKPVKKGKKPWGQRDLWERDRKTGKKIYHDSYCNGGHPAFDLSDKEGADLLAVVDGVIVTGTKTQKQGGNFGGTIVLADHKGDYQYIYGHAKNLTVKVGDVVKQGDKLGEQSNTNYYNNQMNSHLHFQVQHQKYYADEKTFVCTGINPLNIDVTKYVGDESKTKKSNTGSVKKLGKKVALDIGHGKNTFPSQGKGVYRNGRGYAEFSFNNKLAKRIKPMLENHGFDVVMAQPFDGNDVGLVRRTNYYDAQRCDLGLSLHANAGTASVGGRCAFYWTTSKQGKRFASSIIKNMKDMGYGVHGNGLHASAYGSWTNLHMVRECTTFPMVLVEHGFMTNNLDFPLIFGNKQDQYIKDMAEANVKAVCSYFGVSYKGAGKAPAPSKPSRGTKLYRVQVGAFKKRSNATSMTQKLVKKKYDTHLAYDDKENLYRVQVGAYSKKSNANNQLKKLKKDGFKDAFIANNDGHAATKETQSPAESKKTPRTIGDWKTNKHGTQYIRAEGTFTVGATRIMSRSEGPYILDGAGQNNEGGWLYPGHPVNYTYLLRSEDAQGRGFVWVEYEQNGATWWAPYNNWDARTGNVGPEEWGTFS